MYVCMRDADGKIHVHHQGVVVLVARKSWLEVACQHHNRRAFILILKYTSESRILEMNEWMNENILWACKGIPKGTSVHNLRESQNNFQCVFLLQKYYLGPPKVLLSVVLFGSKRDRIQWCCFSAQHDTLSIHFYQL